MTEPRPTYNKPLASKYCEAVDRIKELERERDVFIYQIKRVLNECNLWNNQPLYDDLYKLLPKEQPFIREVLS